MVRSINYKVSQKSHKLQFYGTTSGNFPKEARFLSDPCLAPPTPWLIITVNFLAIHQFQPYLFLISLISPTTTKTMRSPISRLMRKPAVFLLSPDTPSIYLSAFLCPTLSEWRTKFVASSYQQLLLLLLLDMISLKNFGRLRNRRPWETYTYIA